MNRSEFLKKSLLSGVALAFGATSLNGQQIFQPDPDDPYTWKPGQPITIKSVRKTEDEWRKQLTDKQFYILREDGTEKPFDNPYWDNKKEGIYFCAGCALPVYSSKTKFKSGTGWPSFYQPVDPKVVHKVTDTSAGMVRGEIECAQCRGHLGHVFNDGPEPTGLRYCMDSYALHFKKMKV